MTLLSLCDCSGHTTGKPAPMITPVGAGQNCSHLPIPLTTERFNTESLQRVQAPSAVKDLFTYHEHQDSKPQRERAQRKGKLLHTHSVRSSC